MPRTIEVTELILRDGPNLVQLLKPLAPESPVAKQIKKNGGRGGLADVALSVAGVQKAFSALKAKGIQIIVFVHPKTTEAAALGYRVEVVQEA
jgi:methylmalonyl-CoA/ethylmalonyl-CoA epimerase